MLLFGFQAEYESGNSGPQGFVGNKWVEKSNEPKLLTPASKIPLLLDRYVFRHPAVEHKKYTIKKFKSSNGNS